MIEKKEGETNERITKSPNRMKRDKGSEGMEKGDKEDRSLGGRGEGSEEKACFVALMKRTLEGVAN
jgi:hypothetical protein